MTYRIEGGDGEGLGRGKGGQVHSAPPVKRGGGNFRLADQQRHLSAGAHHPCIFFKLPFKDLKPVIGHGWVPACDF